MLIQWVDGLLSGEIVTTIVRGPNNNISTSPHTHSPEIQRLKRYMSRKPKCRAQKFRFQNIPDNQINNPKPRCHHQSISDAEFNVFQ
jgi:hypothetical protein